MQGNSFSKLIYNHNPFYLISAGVVLYGVHTSIAVEPGQWVNYWRIAAVLAVSILLMAIAAFGIVRFGKVWDDARSIFMVIFLLLFALSVSLDELCVLNTNLAISMIVSLFLFAVLISEFLLRSLQIRLPTSFRVPYYLILILTFFYPLVFSRDAIWHGLVSPMTLLFLFPIAGAVLLMSLLPAIQSGAELVKKNGTPWQWPLYPWAIFVFMAVGLVGRSYLLCEAFDVSPGRGTIWSGIFVAPLILAAAVLLLEIGIREGNHLARQFSLVLCALAIPATLTGTVHSQAMLDSKTIFGLIGSPFWLCAINLVAIYFYAWSRRIERADVWLGLALVLNIFVQPDSYRLAFTELSSWPIAFLSGYLLFSALQKNSCWHFVLGSGTVSFGLGVSVAEWFEAELAWMAALHAFLCLILFAGWHFNDRLALQLNAICAGVFAFATSLMLLIGFSQQAPILLVLSEIGVFWLLAMVGFWFNRDRLLGLSSLLILSQVSSAGVLLLVSRVQDSGDRRLVYFLVGAAICFAAGIFISSLKAGLSRRIGPALTMLKQDLVSRFVVPVSAPVDG